MSTALEVVNLSKEYRIGAKQNQFNTLRDSVMDVATAPFRRLSSLMRGEAYGAAELSESLWALRDVSFTVQQGDVVGIIGRNGAGKSTLLKILSQITEPTHGQVRLYGRVGSLLEVGTGFHQELTGRENIYLNGAILGMRKHEITARLDEIVDFSGIERYIDTPVKRYSSGMFVRLAFAVAAHLEPDILILDEVLAVGDAEFQKKCLDKMKDVSQNYGRTVLFVSHNVAAVKQLCNKAMLLENGTVKHIGSVASTLEIYQETDKDYENGIRNASAAVNDKGYFTGWKITGQNSKDLHTCISGETANFNFSFECVANLSMCEVYILINYDDSQILFIANSKDTTNSYFDLDIGSYDINFSANLPVRPGKFGVRIAFLSKNNPIDIWNSNTKLNILDNFNISGLHTNEGILNIPTSFNYQASN